jgi:CDP-glucose 4,6-dehydratase
MYSAPNSDFWIGRRVLVTGHTGFKGSWLCLWLRQLGAEVFGLSDAIPTTPSHFETIGLAEDLSGDLRGDVRSRLTVLEALKASDPDIVFHLAAQPLVSVGYSNPTETFEVNFNGTLHVLEAARERRRPTTLVVVTSDKCYEPFSVSAAHRESDPMGGHDPYSASKGIVELLCSSYRSSFFSGTNSVPVRLATVRAGNVIGGGDWAGQRLVPDAARSLSADQPLILRNPDYVRPWQHVLEPLSGYLQLAERLHESSDLKWQSGWNFGPSPQDAVAVRQIASWFVETWGSGEVKVEVNPNAIHETNRLRLAIDKAVAELNWYPKWSARTAVERAALWYRRVFDCGSRQAMREQSLDDIQHYNQSPRT